MARRTRSWRTWSGPVRDGSADAGALREAITAHEPGQGDPIRFEGIRVRGALDLSRCRIDAALEFVHCDFDEPLRLDDLSVRALDLSGSTVPALYADRILVEGQLRLSETRLGSGANDPRPLLDPAMNGQGIRAPRRVHEGSATAVLRLADARIDGSLVAERLVVVDSEQWSVLAPRMTVGGSVQARGLKTSGALYLRNARVTWAVLLQGAEVGGIDATGLACGGAFYADWGFRSTGQVLLRAAEVGGVVTFQDSVLSEAGALLLSRLHVPRLRLDLREPPAGAVVLRDATVEVLVDSEETWPAPGKLHLEGFTYQRLETARPVEVRSRIAWLTRDAHAAAGTFEQLAKSYETAGDERAARTVRHARERHVRRRDRLSGRVWGVMQDVLFGYGYAPSRALLWLVALATAGAVWFGSRPPRPTGGDTSRAWDPVLYSLDLLVPVASLGYRGAWDPEGVDKAVAVFLVVSGWVLATAVIAGARRVLGRN